MNLVRKSKTTYSLFQTNYLQFLSDNPWIQCPHCKTAGNFIRDGKIPSNNKFNLKCKSCLKKISEDILLNNLLELKIVSRSLIDSWASPVTTNESLDITHTQTPIPDSPGLPPPIPPRTQPTNPPCSLNPTIHTPSPIPPTTSAPQTECLETLVKSLSETLAQKEAIITSMMQQIEHLTSELDAWKEASKNLDNIIRKEQPPAQLQTPRTKRRRQDSPPTDEADQDPAPLWSTMGKKNRAMTQSQRLLVGIKSKPPQIMEPTQEHMDGPTLNIQDNPHDTRNRHRSNALRSPLQLTDTTTLLFSNVVPHHTKNCAVGKIRKLLSIKGLDLTNILDINWLRRGILSLIVPSSRASLIQEFCSLNLQWTTWKPKVSKTPAHFSAIMTNRRENDWAFYSMKDLLFILWPNVIAGESPKRLIIDTILILSPLPEETLSQIYDRAESFVRRRKSELTHQATSVIEPSSHQ